jgi:hypothetical protein
MQALIIHTHYLDKPETIARQSVEYAIALMREANCHFEDLHDED